LAPSGPGDAIARALRRRRRFAADGDEILQGEEDGAVAREQAQPPRVGPRQPHGRLVDLRGPAGRGGVEAQPRGADNGKGRPLAFLFAESPRRRSRCRRSRAVAFFITILMAMLRRRRRLDGYFLFLPSHCELDRPYRPASLCSGRFHSSSGWPDGQLLRIYGMMSSTTKPSTACAAAIGDAVS
jgi:hypothetical protein